MAVAAVDVRETSSMPLPALLRAGADAMALEDFGACPLPLPSDERARLRLLRELDILDTLPEAIYDDIVQLAARICDTPIAAISLVDRDRQWFKARVGVSASETPRDISFCSHALVDPDRLFVIEDAATDPRFAANPLVTGRPHVRFYAGAAIRIRGREAIGALCVIDTRPRPAFDDGQRASLQALARQTAVLLEMRLQQRLAEQQALEMQRMSAAADCERRFAAQRLDMVLRGGNLGLWDLHVPTGRFVANARQFEMLGLPADTDPAAFRWRTLVHPADWTVLNAALGAHARGETDHYHCELRMRHTAGHWVWLLCNATIVERDARGEPERIVGTHMDISVRVREQEASAQAAELLQRMGSMAGIGGWELDIASGRSEWTEEVYRLYELERSTNPSVVDALSHFPMPGRAVLEQALERAMRHGEGYDLELPFVTASGRQLHVRAHCEPSMDAGSVVRLVGTLQDITARKLAERAAFESQRRLRLVADHVPAMISYIDADQRYRFVNRHMCEWLGLEASHTVGRTLRETRGEVAYRVLRPHAERALRGEKTDFAYDFCSSRGAAMRLHASYVPDVGGDGTVAGFYALTVDITDLHRAHQRLEELARIDTLTGLPNRRLFNERIDGALLRAQRSGRPLALMFLDIDRFKNVNDTYGHAAGDAVLVEFAQRIRQCMRTTDTVARMSGDEFVIVCEGAGEPAVALTLAQKIIECMRAPFQLADGPLEVTTSIGIALTQGEEPNASDLLARADRALYEAKRNGRDGCALAAA